MGFKAVVGMLEMLDEDTTLRWHLANNLYPPVGDAFNLAKAAIEACADEDVDRIIEDGELQARAFKIVELFHLEAFVMARIAKALEALEGSEPCNCGAAWADGVHEADCPQATAADL